MLFEEKPLHHIKYPELAEFIELELREGLRLDYKGSPTDKVVETACAFANTAGGTIIVGAGESGNDRPSLAALEGVEARDIRRVRDTITGYTRPPITPEI